MLEKQGDLAAAEEAFREALASGHADVAPRAANSLGLLLESGRTTPGQRRLIVRRPLPETWRPGRRTTSGSY